MNMIASLMFDQRMHPLMTAQDAVKNLFQSVWGNGHLINDPAGAKNYLLEEIKSMGDQPHEQMIQPLGDHYIRLNLRPAIQAGIHPEWIVSMMMMSANEKVPDKTKKLQMQILLSILSLGFNRKDTVLALDRVFKNGELPSHSDAYRTAYKPAYRVLSSYFTKTLLILTEIARNEKNGSKRQLIGIDGCCASGKTTLASVLGSILNAPVIHMDDFFTPHAQKTPERLAEPGGNADLERFRNEVILPYTQNESFAYLPYNCHLDQFTEPITVPSTPYTIIEGSYCLHPKLNAPYDIRIFRRIPLALQKERILQRNGPEMLKMFEERWIPLEEAYFSACHLPNENCLTL